jgi:hypothetical protein
MLDQLRKIPSISFVLISDQTFTHLVVHILSHNLRYLHKNLCQSNMQSKVDLNVNYKDHCGCDRMKPD